MANVWTDQPIDGDGDDLFYQEIGKGYALQIQEVEIAGGIINYSGTVGNLFGSETVIDDDLTELLKTVNAMVHRVQT